MPISSNFNDALRARQSPADIAETGASPAPTLAQITYQLNQWASHASRGEHRTVAVDIILEHLEQHGNTLNLSGLALKTFPPYLPPNLERIDISNNRISQLPEFQQSVRHILAADNLVRILPASLPEALETLDLNRNGVFGLTAQPLPNLTRVRLGSSPWFNPQPNRVVAAQVENVPVRNNAAGLPCDLQNLSAESDPEDDIEVLDVSLEPPPPVDVQDYRAALFRMQAEFNANAALFPRPAMAASDDLELDRLAAELDAGTHSFEESSNTSSDPRFFGYTPNGYNQTPREIRLRYMRDTVEANAAWDRIILEPNAIDFFQVLARLDNAAQMKPIHRMNHTEVENLDKFKKYVGQWLEQLAENEALRTSTFTIANEATASCRDSVLATFNTMQIARDVHQIESGKYDQDIPELVTTSRNVFRQECLEQVARDKMASRDSDGVRLRDRLNDSGNPAVDEIEVYLGYQSQLKGALQLTSTVSEMYFYAPLTSDDLKSAEADVKTKENAGFASWLASWTPFVYVMARLDPAGHEAMRDELVETMESETFGNLVAAAVAEMNISDDPAATADAERIASKTLADRLTAAADMQFAEDFMAHKGLSGLLAPKWQVA